MWDARADLGAVVVSNMVVRVTVREKEQDPHGGVQLWAGGPIWADRNLGADQPWDYGRYFCWGDTVGSLPGGFSFSWETTPTYDKDNATLRSEGWITAAGVLAPMHDAAQVQWGGEWRMPTDQELRGLNENCDWMWTTMNGVNGYVLRGQGIFAGASIFIPAAGIGYGASLSGVGSQGCFWSSVPGSRYNYFGSWTFGFDFDSGVRGEGFNSREYGFPVRPVREIAQ